jgi:hypothetical protein
MGYSALAAGASLLPVNLLMLLLSPWVGRFAHRVGARGPMVIGAFVTAIGFLFFARVIPGRSYVGAVLPAAIVFGIGLSIFVAPLTGAVLGAVDPGLTGVASATNNAAARLAGLLATVIVPAAAGIGSGMSEGASLSGSDVSAGFARAMWIGAVLCVAGGLVAWATVGDRVEVTAAPHPSVQHACVGARAR